MEEREVMGKGHSQVSSLGCETEIETECGGERLRQKTESFICFIFTQSCLRDREVAEATETGLKITRIIRWATWHLRSKWHYSERVMEGRVNEC